MYFVFLLSTTSDDFNGYPGGDPYRANAPPPPGFRSEFSNFTPNAGSPYGASCGEGQAGFGSRPESSRTSTGAGGFWTGAAAGGLLGYMFGNRGYRMIFLTVISLKFLTISSYKLSVLDQRKTLTGLPEMIIRTMHFGVEPRKEIVEIHQVERQALEPGQHRGLEERLAVNNLLTPFRNFFYNKGCFNRF